MKNLFPLLLFIWTVFACSEITDLDTSIENSPQKSNSTVITKAKAIEIALNFRNPSSPSASSRSENQISDIFVILDDTPSIISRAETADKFKDTLLYIINYSRNSGFSVISAKNILKSPIIANSDYGYFNPNKTDSLPPAFLKYITMTKYGLVNNELMDTFHRIDALPEEPYLPWDGIDRFDTIIKQPLLYTKWDQKSPYNLYAPNKIAGCGPVAVGQTLAYFMLPLSFSYVDENTNSHYDITMHWPQIKSDCKNNNGRLSLYNHPQSSHEVAHLLRHIGIDVNANYSNKETGTDPDTILEWVRTNTNLNVKEPVKYEFYSIRNDIMDGNIVFCSGYKDPFMYEGHGWLFDGYIVIRKNGNHIGQYLHCNWGWGGLCDGYYQSNVFNLKNGPIFTDVTDTGGTTGVGEYKYWITTSTISKR